MSYPLAGDLIDIHTHGSMRKEGIFSVENLMIHEDRKPDADANAFSVGIHPWHIEEKEIPSWLDKLAYLAGDERVVAIGEAGYDRRRGPSPGIQQMVFEAQAGLADRLSKPLVIHCVKGWDDLWASRQRIKPSVPWIIHGFNGSVEQAGQLIAGGMYLSLWVKSVLNSTISPVIKAIGMERVFLETDGFDVPLENVYEKAAGMLGITSHSLASKIRENYMKLFG